MVAMVTYYKYIETTGVPHDERDGNHGNHILTLLGGMKDSMNGFLRKDIENQMIGS